METLEAAIAEHVAEEIEESSQWGDSFPIKLEDHELDALAFELWRQGSRAGWTPDETPEGQ